MEWKVRLAAIIMLLLGVQLAAAVLFCFLWRSVSLALRRVGFSSASWCDLLRRPWLSQGMRGVVGGFDVP